MRMRECKWADKNHLQRFFTIENVYLFMHIPYSIWIAMLKMVTTSQILYMRFAHLTID